MFYLVLILFFNKKLSNERFDVLMVGE